ncbi:ATPase, T2SS/T4P/T4SS family [Dyella caseinilytica]|uniref:Flp pilus assembly complex ATPase component TadA n=1 Tax=Dyella caseinilytica TaxID=1849581 RepID=A0ABX7GYY0_9GAMM|nr:ATPase, T2SS/T4P/T4SS family [Dyella caseinilytica]QRN54380.1 Flp pilus assembly complex ATPase component TadA [Dyella caseinilytica]GFZ93731.1 secretory protein [Dyella caseinilytica]
MFEILIETSNRDKRQVRCLHDVCFIGRGDDNLVILQGWNIAREHAALHLRQGGVFIEVLGGRAPVAVNGTRVQNLHGPLLRDDLVTIGAYRLRVLVDQAEAAPLKVPREAANAPSHLTAVAPSPPPTPSAPATEAASAPYEATPPNPAMLEWRTKVHLSLVKQMDLRRVDVRGMSDVDLREKTSALIEEIIEREFDTELPPSIDRIRLAKEVLDEAIGLGPLEDLIADESVTEIMVNRSDEIFIERAGRIEKSAIIFTGDKAVLAAIERIVAPLGRRIDESSPMVDARLADGSRVNAVIPPIALRGPSISIRKFSKRKLMGEDLLKFGSINEPMLEFVQMAVRERKNIVVTGGTGSGKTTLLNILSNFIPDDERIVTIEDAAELKLSQSNLVSLEARPANLEGKGIITIRDLVRNALRMRPDRIVVGECRGGEALDMLQAMNTGHEGSLTTAHANSPRDALSRLEVMVLMSSMDLPMTVVREQIASAVDLIIHQRRFPCGSRKVTHIWEITGIESGTIQTQELFAFRARDQGGPGGRVRGEFGATGAVPEFYEELADRGVPVDLSIFKPAGGQGHE